MSSFEKDKIKNLFQDFIDLENFDVSLHKILLQSNPRTNIGTISFSSSTIDELNGFERNYRKTDLQKSYVSLERGSFEDHLDFEVKSFLLKYDPDMIKTYNAEFAC